MKLIFFSQESYPEGGAACNRHLAYMQGLASRGYDITLYAFGRQAVSYSTPALKVIGVNITARSRVLFHIKSCLAMFLLCLRLNKHATQELRWVYLGTSGLLLLPFMTVARVSGIRTFHERTELPSLMVGAGLFNKLDHTLYKLLLCGFLGIYVISRALQSEMRRLTGAGVKVYVVNMIVDLSRFQNVHEEPNSVLKTITYCGDLSSPKDGVDILIRSFALACVSINESPFILKLAGSTDNEYTQKKLRPLIDELNVSDKIEFLGQVRRQDVPALLSCSDLLVLARPSSEQAAYGFPTKLGEYLASKKPVLVTNTGEISMYLTDGVDVFLVQPNDVEAFAERIVEISRNYKEALRIGCNGYAAAEMYFSVTSAAECLETIFIGS